MKTYIASYQNAKDECWDIRLNAENYKAAAKDARSHQTEMGKLFSLRLAK